jgi:hypothetical protein
MGVRRWFLVLIGKLGWLRSHFDKLVVFAASKITLGFVSLASLHQAK